MNMRLYREVLSQTKAEPQQQHFHDEKPGEHVVDGDKRLGIAIRLRKPNMTEAKTATHRQRKNVGDCFPHDNKTIATARAHKRTYATRYGTNARKTKRIAPTTYLAQIAEREGNDVDANSQQRRVFEDRVLCECEDVAAKANITPFAT